MNRRLELLECFRGIATILIVAFHATVLFKLKFNRIFLLSFFKFGDAGVDFFFVLSGFFLALAGLKYIDSKGNGVKRFLLRRFVRIYPFYWLVNLFVIPIYFLVPSFGKGYEREVETIAKSLLLIPQTHSPILTVAWFLTHLVFFYLLFGLLAIIKPRLSLSAVFIWLTLSFAFLSFDLLTKFQLSQNSPYLINFFLSYYNLEFFAGFLIGSSFLRTKASEKNSLAFLQVGLCLFLISGCIETYLLPDTAGTIDYYNFLTYGSASMLIVKGAASLEKNKKIKVHNFFLSLGAASYSIYLIHYPLLSLFSKLIQTTHRSGFVFLTASMVSACCLSIAFGYAIHIFIEKKVIFMLGNRLNLQKGR